MDWPKDILGNIKLIVWNQNILICNLYLKNHLNCIFSLAVLTSIDQNLTMHNCQKTNIAQKAGLILKTLHIPCS